MHLTPRPRTCLAALAFCALPGLAVAQDGRSLEGLAHNVTAGIKSGITLQMWRSVDGGYTLSGAFDHLTLFGDVTATGRAPVLADGQPVCATGHECVLFAGELTLDARSGYPDGTRTGFALSLDIDVASTIATGVFHIGQLPGLPFEQYGIISVLMAGS